MHAHGQTLTGYGLLSSRQSGTRNIDVRFDSKANGTGVLRQFASKATRLGSRVAFWRLGVYWKPVWHILEGHFVLILANAAHVKTVPGRKSDVNDATWLADLLVLVASLARPSDNATDLSTEQVDIAGKRLEILRELVPDFTRLAIVANVGNPGAVLEDARGRGSGPSARSANRPTRNQAGTGYRVARQRRVASERVPAIGITVSGATEEERQCAKRQLQPYCLHWESFPSSRRAPTQWSPSRPVCGQP